MMRKHSRKPPRKTNPPPNITDEHSKYEHLYAHTGYARLRVGKHLTPEGGLKPNGYWTKMFKNVFTWYTIMECNPPILDVGSGPRNLARTARMMGKTKRLKVTSVDFAASANPDIVADAANLPMEDNSYDFVTSLDMMEHILEPQVPTVLGELARVSRRAAFLTIAYGEESRRYDVGPLHVTIKPPAWWAKQISKHFEIADVFGKQWRLRSKP